MKNTIPKWILCWLVISITIVSWDVSFLLMRPNSLPGGELFFIWEVPYLKYISVDHSYADMDNAFIKGQALMSIIEIFIAVAALIINGRGNIPTAAVLIFSSTLLTSAKTLLIFLVEIMSDFENIGHNQTSEIVNIYLIPNAIWVIIPLIISIYMARQLIRGCQENPYNSKDSPVI